MKKIVYLFVALTAIVTAISSCSDSETYADQKKRERSAINKYITDNNIKVLTEAEFKAQNCTTDTSKHEYVYLIQGNLAGLYI